MAFYTKAFNGIKSTMKADWDILSALPTMRSQMRGRGQGLGETLFGRKVGDSRTGGFLGQAWDEMKKAPALFGKGQAGEWGAAGRVAGYGAAGLTGGAMAADFANPWGLGFGD